MRKRLLSFLSSNQILTLFVLVTFCTVHFGFSQNQVYADQVVSAINVDDAANAIDPSDTYATLNSYGGVAVGIGGYSGELGLAFPSLLPANTTTYLKIDFEEDVLNSLLGGNLGDLLANVLGTVVLGNHYFEIEAKNGATTVFSRSSMTASEHEDFRIVMDSEGNYYAAITPDQSYDRIYITDKTSALLLGTSNDMKVYNAFYFTHNNCAKDPLYTDFDGEGLTLDVLSLGNAGVTNPENALNDDPNSYSELSIGVLGVAASIQQNIYFSNVYTPQDTFTVTLKTDPTLVTLGLLNMVSVLAYENEQIVYQTDLSSVLNLDLLTLLQNGEKAEVPFAPGVGFDKVAIRLSTLVSVNVAQSLDVYAISIEDTPTPTTDSASQEFCAVDAPTVSDIDVNEGGVIWYDVADGGTPLAGDEALVDGGEYYGTLVGPNGCESATRLQVSVALNDTGAPTTDSASQEFCAVDAPTVSDIDVNEGGVIWYDVADGGTPLAGDEALVDGGEYYGTLVGPNGCESATRLQVSVALNDTGAPTTDSASQEFCAVDAPTISDIDVNEGGVIWYDVADGGTPLAGDEALVDGGKYYGTLVGPNGCESATRLQVSVMLNDTAAPTTDSASQEFCAVDAPTVSDIDVNEGGVIWYDVADGGTPLAGDEALVDGGEYYGTLVGPNGCESATRLQVSVMLNDTAAPTTDSASQEFCAVDAPTVSDIDVNEGGVIWYDVADGGTPLAGDEALVDGGEYYGTLVGPNGCESATRLQVSVALNDTGAPTTDSASQEFCAVDAPTVSDIDVNEGGVIWYDVADGGTPLAGDEALVDGGEYYGTLVGPNGCESATRLQVSVMLNDTAAPTTDSASQEFCAVDAPTVADIQVNEPNVVWYDSLDSDIPLDMETSLIDGNAYYGAQVSNGCESAQRTKITVFINDTTAPTTENVLQEFCATDGATVLDLMVNESDVVWYDSLDSDIPLDSETLLVDGGKYYAALLGSNGCESSGRLEITVAINEVSNPTITSSSANTACLNETVTYYTEENKSNYQWEVTGGSIVAGGTNTDNFVSVYWEDIENTSVAVLYDTGGACQSNMEKSVFNETVTVCSDISINIDSNDTSPAITDEIVIVVTVANNGPNEFTDVLIENVIPTGFEFIGASTSTGTYSNSDGTWAIDMLGPNSEEQLEIRVRVQPSDTYMVETGIVRSTPEDSDTTNNSATLTLNPKCLVVYNEFSPNGDGINDTFVISCIENYPNNSLKVFDKYGSLIYEMKGYANNWDGVPNVSGVSSTSQGLPSGTYYYVLEIGDGQKPLTGWLYFQR